MFCYKSDWGGVLKEQGNLEQAISYYRQAMELNSDNYLVYIGLGDIYREQGNLGRLLFIIRMD